MFIITLLCAVCFALSSNEITNSIQDGFSQSQEQDLQRSTMNSTGVGSDKDEIMETADMIVFRPLFVYRKKIARRYPYRRRRIWRF